MKVAVVGATGMVGTVMIKVLEERNLPITEFIPVASERSAGKKLCYKGKEFTIVTLADAVKMQPDVALFSAGGDTSLEWAPKFAEVGTTVIDNSSAWRMDPTKKLVVPDIQFLVLESDFVIPEKDFVWYQKPDFCVGTIVSFLVPENDLMVQRKRLLETTHGWRTPGPTSRKIKMNCKSRFRVESSQRVWFTSTHDCA